MEYSGTLIKNLKFCKNGIRWFLGVENRLLRSLETAGCADAAGNFFFSKILKISKFFKNFKTFQKFQKFQNFSKMSKFWKFLDMSIYNMRTLWYKYNIRSLTIYVRNVATRYVSPDLNSSSTISIGLLVFIAYFKTN